MTFHDASAALQSIVSMVAPQIHNVDIEDMAPNSGATIQKGLRKVAVYKDEEGKKHAFSALCPHLGCLLQVRCTAFCFWAFRGHVEGHS